jgi:hypothetical protein
MAFTAKPLSDGQLSDSQAAIYTVPADTAAYVKFLSLYNTSASPQTVTLWINVSGTARAWKQFVLQQDDFEDIMPAGLVLTLETGDTIEAVSTDASAVDYVISGVEET